MILGLAWGANGADGLFLPPSTTAAVVATAMTSAIAAALFVARPREPDA